MPPSNTELYTQLWDILAKTDPAHTKKFTRPGGFKGTAIKPIYLERKMTEQFGPCGVGWGFDEPVFSPIQAGDEMAVYCTLTVWYRQGDVTGKVSGVGGDMILKQFSNGRIAVDDEAYKKAFTDALGNALKHLGMSADVHMGQHDDNKYVSDLRREFSEAPAPKPETPAQNPKHAKANGEGAAITKVKKSITDFAGDVKACDDVSAFEGLVFNDETKSTLVDCIIHAESWWMGTEDAAGLRDTIQNKIIELTEPGSQSVSDVVELLGQAETRALELQKQQKEKA